MVGLQVTGACHCDVRSMSSTCPGPITSQSFDAGCYNWHWKSKLRDVSRSDLEQSNISWLMSGAMQCRAFLAGAEQLLVAGLWSTGGRSPQ